MSTIFVREKRAGVFRYPLKEQKHLYKFRWIFDSVRQVETTDELNSQSDRKDWDELGVSWITQQF
jgi:hypothetical protein